jgi:hypothetical protein
MSDIFWWQAAALFWAALCFFRVGAMTKGIAPDRKMWAEIAQAAAIVVLLFGLVTEGRGCRGLSSIEPPACADTTAC